MCCCVVCEVNMCVCVCVCVRLRFLFCLCRFVFSFLFSTSLISPSFFLSSHSLHLCRSSIRSSSLLSPLSSLSTFLLLFPLLSSFLYPLSSSFPAILSFSLFPFLSFSLSFSLSLSLSSRLVPPLPYLSCGGDAPLPQAAIAGEGQQRSPIGAQEGQPQDGRRVALQLRRLLASAAAPHPDAAVGRPRGRGRAACAVRRARDRAVVRRHCGGRRQEDRNTKNKKWTALRRGKVNLKFRGNNAPGCCVVFLSASLAPLSRFAWLVESAAVETRAGFRSIGADFFFFGKVQILMELDFRLPLQSTTGTSPSPFPFLLSAARRCRRRHGRTSQQTSPCVYSK